MKATRQLLPTHLAAVHLLKVTWLVVECCLAANTQTCRQVRTGRAFHIVRMTLMDDRRMTAAGLALALTCTRRLTSTTRLWRVKNRFATIAANFLPYGLGTARTSSTMAKLFAIMRTALERSATRVYTDMFGFDWERVGTNTLLLLLSNPLDSLLLARATMLATAVSSTVSVCLADLEAQRVLNFCAVTHRLRCDSTTAAINFHDAGARVTIPSVTK